MHEIGVEPFVADGDAGKDRLLACHVQRVPSHVRDLELRVGGRDLHHVAGDPAEPFGRLLLQPALGHELAADADAEERLAAPDHLLVQRLHHARHRVETAAAIGEGADARQHDAVGRRHDFRVRGDDDRVARLARRALERLGGGVKVSRAVIDDGDAHSRAPSASGKSPRIGSSLAATAPPEEPPAAPS